MTRHAPTGQVGRLLARGPCRAKGQTHSFGPLSRAALSRLRACPMPVWVPPMRAALTDERVFDPAWVLERKIDGEPCLASVREEVRLASRSRRPLNKCVAEQELVIGGWTAPEGRRTDFGALLIGYYEADALVYAGKVGTGWDEEVGFRRWTRAGRLRHPRYLGLGPGKPAKQVVRETSSAARRRPGA